MADETVTEPVNTAAPEEQATTPAPEASAATPAPTPSPASMPKPHAPSPAAFAKKTPATKPRAAAPAAATAAYSEADVKAAEAFGRVDDNGTVFYFYSRHQNAVDDFCSGAYGRTGKEHRVFHFAVNDAALGDESTFDVCIGSDIMGQCSNVLGVDFPAGIV